jgi:hypothetical protein
MDDENRPLTDITAMNSSRIVLDVPPKKVPKVRKKRKKPLIELLPVPLPALAIPRFHRAVTASCPDHEAVSLRHTVRLFPKRFVQAGQAVPHSPSDFA